MKIWRLFVFFSPTLLGMALALYFFRYFDQNIDHVIYLRTDFGTFSLILGIGFSLLVAVVFILKDRVAQIRRDSAFEAAEERRRFFLRLDHELKNPLTAILAGLANLAPSIDDDAHLKILNSIETQTIRLSRLSSDLRKLAELEVRLVENSPVDISALLHEAYGMAQEHPQAFERNMNLNLPQAPWPLPCLRGDPDLLLLAVYNLLENAIKFSRPGDTLELRAFEDGQELVIEVADTGPGIPDNEKEHVWEELYRGEIGHGIPGSGLGLALVRAIAERYFGKVSLRTRLGQGTVFTLRLPM